MFIEHCYMRVLKQLHLRFEFLSSVTILNLMLQRCLSVLYEPPRDKTNKMACAPSEDSDQPGHKESLGSLATQWVHSEDSDQTGRMPRLIWVFAGRTVILLVLSWGGSYFISVAQPQKFGNKTFDEQYRLATG